METRYRPDIEEPPEPMRHLGVSRGYPVPWFVPWINGEPEFRAAASPKRVQAVMQNLCWVCGTPLQPPPKEFRVVVGFAQPVTFVIGPMGAINRTTAEPPCHHECALYSIRNCPFLSKPQMVRRENDLPEHSAPGVMIERNPSVSLLWSTRGYVIFGDGSGGWLIRLRTPSQTEWFYRRQPATRAQVEESVRSGFPLLLKMAQEEGPEAVAELNRMEEFARRYWPEG